MPGSRTFKVKVNGSKRVVVESGAEFYDYHREGPAHFEAGRSTDRDLIGGDTELMSGLFRKLNKYNAVVSVDFNERICTVEIDDDSKIVELMEIIAGCIHKTWADAVVKV